MTIGADASKDAVYDGLRAEFGEGSPKASGYLFKRSFLKERALVLETVGESPGVVLDVGCGGGLVTAPLARAGHRVVGVDFNAAACDQARRNGIEAIRADAFGLPLAGGMTDVVLNVEFAQQYEAQAIRRLLDEAQRVLRTGGALVIVWSNRHALLHRIAHPVFAVLARLRGRPLLAPFHHAAAEMQAAGERAGLALDCAYAILPPLGLRLRGADRLLAKLLGSSFLAVFRKP